jgi:hypothetical protein
VRICAGGVGQPSSLPRHSRYNWSFWKFKAEANFSRFLQPHIKLFA